MHVTALGQIDVVPSTFPDAPITLPSADLIRPTEIVAQTEARPRWLMPVLVGGGLFLLWTMIR